MLSIYECTYLKVCCAWEMHSFWRSSVFQFSEITKYIALCLKKENRLTFFNAHYLAIHLSVQYKGAVLLQTEDLMNPLYLNYIHMLPIPKSPKYWQQPQSLSTKGSTILTTSLISYKQSTYGKRILLISITTMKLNLSLWEVHHLFADTLFTIPSLNSPVAF